MRTLTLITPGCSMSCALSTICRCIFKHDGFVAATATQITTASFYFHRYRYSAMANTPGSAWRARCIQVSISWVELDSGDGTNVCRWRRLPPAGAWFRSGSGSRPTPTGWKWKQQHEYANGPPSRIAALQAISKCLSDDNVELVQSTIIGFTDRL